MQTAVNGSLADAAIGGPVRALMGAAVPRREMIGQVQGHKHHGQQQISDNFTIFHWRVTSESPKRVRSAGRFLTEPC